MYQSAFNVTLGVIEVNETSVLADNSAPYLLPPPPREIKAVAGEAFEFQFGKAFDFEGDDVTVFFDGGNADEFVEFDFETLTLYIEEGVTDEETQPLFDLKLTLFDNNPIDPLFKVYDFRLVIVKDARMPILLAIEEAKVTEVIRSYNGRVYDLKGTSIDEVTSVTNRQENIEIPDYNPKKTAIEDILEDGDRDSKSDEKTVIPRIVSLTNDGVARLRFDTPMIIPSLSELTTAKVALRNLKKSEISNEFFETETGRTEFQIRDAFEVYVVPSSTTENPIKLDYTWELLDFTSTEMVIKLYFEIPEAVSASSTDPDNIVVTFWANDLFQAKDGRSVARGLTISAPIYRQVSSDTGKDFKRMGQIAGYVSLGFLIIAFFWANNV